MQGERKMYTKKYRRDFSLSIIPASDSDGGLYLREAYMNDSFMPRQ